MRTRSFPLDFWFWDVRTVGRFCCDTIGQEVVVHCGGVLGGEPAGLQGLSGMSNSLSDPQDFAASSGGVVSFFSILLIAVCREFMCRGLN